MSNLDNVLYIKNPIKQRFFSYSFKECQQLNHSVNNNQSTDNQLEESDSVQSINRQKGEKRKQCSSVGANNSAFQQASDMILNNFFQDPLEHINGQSRKSSRQQKMYVKKSSLKRIQSAVSKKGTSAPQSKEKSLNTILGIKNESIAEKYFAMTQKQKGQKNQLIDNYNELDEMIHNYLFTSNQQQNPSLSAKAAATLQFQNDSKFSRTSSKNLLLSQNFMATYDQGSKSGVTGGPLSNTVSEKIIKNWNVQGQGYQNRGNQGFEVNSDSHSNMGSSSNPSYVDEKARRTKEIYSNLASNNNNNNEYNFMNTNTASTCNTKDENNMVSSKRLDEHRSNNFNIYQSGKSSGQDNSSNILDNNTTNNTISFRSSKLISTPSNINQTNVAFTTGSNTPSYAMGTIVSNNKTNHARRFSRTRPVTAAISKNSNTPLTEKSQGDPSNTDLFNNIQTKPWLRHELFTKKQKGQLMEEDEDNSIHKKYHNFGIESDDGENDDNSKSHSDMNEFKSKSKHHKSEQENEQFSEDCTDSVKNSNQNRRKTDNMAKTAGTGFSGYNKLLRSESNKTDQNICDNIIRDCENILNKIQKRDGQQLYNSQKKENQIFGPGSSSQFKDKNIGARGNSMRNSFRAQTSIPRPQSVKRIPSNNNIFGGPGELIEDTITNENNEDDIMTLQKIANTLLKKKLALKESSLDSTESQLQQLKKNAKGSMTTTGTGQRLQTSSYPHRQYSKDKDDNVNELSQIQELQEQEGVLGEIQIKQTPNIYKKSNSLPRSQSSAKQSNNRFYENGTFTDAKEKMTQEALKAAATIAKNVQKFSGNYSNNNSNAILQRPESKRQQTTGTIVNMNSTATGSVSTNQISTNLFMLNSLKRNSEIKDNTDRTGKENIKSLAQTMKITSTTTTNDLKKIDDNQNISNAEEKRLPLGQNNKQSRPATAAISKSGSANIGEIGSNNNLTTNKLMERFDIKSCIGKGSYAVVKLAKDTHTDKTVAIKMYDKYKLIDPQKRNNVKREIAILNKLDHTNIIKLYQTIDTRSSVNLVMEYISSQSLRQFMKVQDGRQLEEKYARLIFKQLVSAVQYCHEWEVIHRDIKLENIMLDTNNNYQIKLIDFGFAIRIPSDKKLNIFCGTPSYMSPEITKKKEYFGKPADVWSLGVVLYALICSRFPFKGKDDNDLFRKIQSGDYKISGNVSQSGAKLINKLLRQNPLERPTAKEVNKKIQEISLQIKQFNFGNKQILQDRWFME